MSPRGRLLVALALSFALHAVTVVAPLGWGLPMSEDSNSATPLEAHLRAAARHAPVPAYRRARHAKRAAPLPSPPPSAEAAAADAAPQDAVVPAADAPATAPAGDAMNAPPQPAPIALPPPPPPAAAAAAPAGEISLPRQGRIEYAISRGERDFVIGRSVHEWHHDGASYGIRSSNETTGLIALFRSARASLSSEGSVTAAGLEPSEYRADRGSGVDVARFDWAAGKVALSAGDAREVALTPGAQDLLSMFYQLGILLRQGGIGDMGIATGRKFETYGFASVGEESLALPFGSQRTLHLKTRPAPGGDSTEIWLGLDLSNLPLKIRFADRDGEVYYQIADKIEVGGRVIERQQEPMGQNK
jgi:hypothetical protein